MNKISIVGAGRVGEATAQFIAEGDLCRELMLIDIREGVPQGVALDIQETAPLLGFDTRINGSHDPQDVENSDLVIVTAGQPRKPGMSRSDVLEANLEITNSVVDNVVTHAPDCMLLFVSNPVDILTYHAYKRSGFPKNRVFGQAGVLDSTRMASFIAMETGFSVKDINAMVMGGHGDTMVPMTRFTTISGIPIEHFMDNRSIEELVDRTRNGGAEILGLRQTSSAYDAPAAAIASMVDAIVNNRRRIMPCIALLEGEYGETDIAIGVPAILSAEGLEQVVELQLNDAERSMLDHTIDALRKDLATVEALQSSE